MALKYTTTLQLAEIIGVVKEIPSWDVGETQSNEPLGEGDSSETQYFLDHKNIIANSYTLYAEGTAMIETTDYTLDKENGEVTLTGTGVSTLGTNHLTAKYKYFDNGMSDSYINSVLARSEKQVDVMVNSTFTDGTGTNPAYPSQTEIQPSEGFFQDRIITKLKPLKDIETTLNGAHTDSITTISLASGNGTNYPTSGIIIIGSEAITYTGVSTDDLTGCTRGALETTAATHSDGDSVHSTILFRSDTAEGTVVSWTVQPWQTSMYANEDGLIYKFRNEDPDPLNRSGVAERIKIIYFYGHDTIPLDITRLTLILAKKMLIQDNIGKAMIAGRNEFNPEMMSADKQEMDSIINSYIVLPMGNV